MLQVLLAQLAPTPQPEFHKFANLTFSDKELRCEIEVKGGAWFSEKDCLMFLYVNNKPVAHKNAHVVQHRYTALLRATARCEGICTLSGFKEKVKPMEMVINETVFIVMMAGVGVVSLLLIIAVVCGVKHCRGHYYYNKLDKQQHDAESLHQETKT